MTRHQRIHRGDDGHASETLHRGSHSTAFLPDVVQASGLLDTADLPAPSLVEEKARTTPEPKNALGSRVMRDALLALIGGFRVSQMIAIAAKLRIADHLRDGPRTAHALAQLTGSQPDALYRVLRTLASVGVFAEDEPELFRTTPMGDWLRSDVQGNVRVAAEVVGEEWMWRPWGALAHTVATGETAFDALYGQDTWRWFGDHPVAARLFDSLMDDITLADAEAIVAGFDFDVYRDDRGRGRRTGRAAGGDSPANSRRARLPLQRAGRHRVRSPDRPAGSRRPPRIRFGRLLSRGSGRRRPVYPEEHPARLVRPGRDQDSDPPADWPWRCMPRS